VENGKWKMGKTIGRFKQAERRIPVCFAIFQATYTYWT